jgi:hypothetical protein
MARRFLAAIPSPSPFEVGLIFLAPIGRPCWRRYDPTIRRFRDLSVPELRAAVSWFLEETFGQLAACDEGKVIVRPAMVSAVVESLSALVMANRSSWLQDFEFDDEPEPGVNATEGRP